METALAGGVAPDTVVVCPSSFRDSLTPWLEFRQSQGHTIQFISNTGSPEQIRDRIRTAAKPGKLKFVLLVGSANPRMESDAAVRRRSVPTHLEKAKVVDKWGPETEIATDNWYADLDDDGAPDVAIGRLPVESADELAAVVKKILAYDKTPDFHRWRSRLNFVAGASGFDPTIDALLDSTARRLISSGIPAAYETDFTYANWRSAYCPDPRTIHETVLERLNEGCLFWVYIGHGQRTGISRMRLPTSTLRCLDCDDAAGLRCNVGPPIALFLACYTAAFDSPVRCLADELVRAPGGPIAVVGGSRTTMPYAMTVFGSEMIDQCFKYHAATIGEAMMGAKRRMVGVGQKQFDSKRLLMDALAKAASPNGADLEGERTDHLHLFNLIGDPLVALRFPREMELTADRSATTTGELIVKGRSPCDGVCTIELIADDEPNSGPPRREFEFSDKALRDYQRLYRQMNHPALASTEVETKSGGFSAQLPLPADATGPLRVRAFVVGRDSCAAGSARFSAN